MSSELGLEAGWQARRAELPGPTGRIVAYMEALGASELIEGESGRAYFDLERFRALGLRVRFHHYVHPRYEQLHPGFVSHLSALDLLLCAGTDEARRVLERGGMLEGE